MGPLRFSKGVVQVTFIGPFQVRKLTLYEGDLSICTVWKGLIKMTYASPLLNSVAPSSMFCAVMYSTVISLANEYSALLGNRKVNENLNGNISLFSMGKKKEFLIK